MSFLATALPCAAECVKQCDFSVLLLSCVTACVCVRACKWKLLFLLKFPGQRATADTGEAEQGCGEQEDGSGG